MAIDWGAWEGSSPNRIRVGVEVEGWTAGDGSAGPNNGDSQAQTWVAFHVDVEGNWSDSQTLHFGGAFGGSVTFTNNQNNNSVQRERKLYEYDYGNNEYGSSPGKVTFSTNLTGAFNGATPSKSVTVNIPARPIAKPNDPTNVAASYISDTSVKVSWTNKDTSAKPWSAVWVDRKVNEGSWVRRANLSGGATSYTDSTSADNEYQYRVAADNSAGTSGWLSTDTIWTTPAAPTNATRSGAATGGDQVITWTNNASTNDYSTEVWSSTNGAAYVLRATLGTGVATWTDVGTNAANAIKYKVRAKSPSPARYSSYSNETTETAGTTTPPLAPTGLAPNNLTVDPTLKQALTWTFNLAQAGDTQTKFEVNHRLAGAATWSTSGTVTSANKTWDLPANTYADGATVEWRVRTYGADPTPSPWSTNATIQAAVAPVPADPIKVPVQMDLATGQLEANTNAYEQRDYVTRVQSNLMGGGVRAVSSTYGITWSQRFIAISLGRSANTFPGGHHDIVNPYGWTVSTKQIVVTSGISRATLTVTASTVQVRPGETITVSGVGSPYDGQHIVRSTSSNQISYDLPNGTAAQTSTASGGSVLATIKGHGFSPAQDFVPTSSTITLPSWAALYYELPFGWGAGTTVRKNGVAQVTSKAITSNVATIGLAGGHWNSIGDRVNIENVDATFDGEYVVTATTPTSISYSKTAANVTTTTVSSPTAIARPSGKDTFFGNFHMVDYRADFVVPSNWILIAMRNSDSSTVEWGTGDTVDPGFDSDSPVLKQVIFTSTTDASTSAGNKPALRVGSTTGTHLRIDGNEILAMTGDSTQGTLNLNLGGQCTIRDLNVTGAIINATTFSGQNNDFPNIPSGGSANVNMNASASNRIRTVSSARRFKTNIEDLEFSDEMIRKVLSLRPVKYDRIEDPDPDNPTDEPVLTPEIGFIANEAEDAGLIPWCVYDKDGEIFSFDYFKWTVALQAVCQHQQASIKALEERLARLEAGERK